MRFLIISRMVAVLVLRAAAVAVLACGGGPVHPEVQVDCPDCPVLVMGQPDTDAWRVLDNADSSSYTTSPRTVLVGCAYGVVEKAGLPTYVFSSTPEFDQVGRGSHIAVGWVLDDDTGPVALGECYETHALHVSRDTWRDMSDLPVHVFDVVERLLLTDAEWRRWQAVR